MKKQNLQQLPVALPIMARVPGTSVLLLGRVYHRLHRMSSANMTVRTPRQTAEEFAKATKLGCAARNPTESVSRPAPQ